MPDKPLTTTGPPSSRQGSDRHGILKLGSLTLDLETGTATRAGRVLRLWPKQFSLLLYLVRHADQVVTRKAIAENVWGDRMAMWTNVITVNINGLRKELERDGLPTMLHTIRGQGYLLGEGIE